MAIRKATPKITLPKAKNLEEALKLVPQWKSAVVVPQQWVEVFDANPGLIGGLTPELMKQVNNQTEAKLAQVEMANAFYDSLVLQVGAHREIEELRAKSIVLMIDTKTAEDEYVMDALLAGTGYEQHLVQWRHELAAKQGLLKDQTEQINQTTTADISVQLQKSFNTQEQARTRLQASLEPSASSQVVDVEAQKADQEEIVREKTARANFQKMLKRG